MLRIRPIRALHVIAGLASVYGGPSYSVPRLCQALGKTGTITRLFSVDTASDCYRASPAGGYCDRRFAWEYTKIPVLRGLRYSSGLSQALYSGAPEADVVHNHGIWLMPNVIAARAAARSAKPFIVSTRGMLAPAALAFSPLRKRAFWALLQGAAVRSAACLHATSEQEYSEIRAFGLTNPVAIIRNGIDVPESPAIARPQRERIVLALGRIHPKKGLAALLEAWAKVAPANPDWRLRIVGPAEGNYDRELQAVGYSLGCINVSIEEPLYGAAKTTALCEADLFVLPSLNENFGLTVAEALAVGTPAIATKGTPWPGLESKGCGWWVDHGPEALSVVLAAAMALPREALKDMGAIGRGWMKDDFSWDHVAIDMLRVYRWLADSGDVPSVVRLG